MAGEKKSGYHPGGGVRGPIKRVKRPTVKHSGMGGPGSKKTPTTGTGRRGLRAPTLTKRPTVRHSGMGGPGSKKTPTTGRRRLKAPTPVKRQPPRMSVDPKRMPTQARPARRSTRGSTPRSNPMSRFRQANRRAMNRFNRSRRR